MSFQFNMSGVEGVLREIQAAGKAVERDASRAMYRIGTLVKDTAQDYAPISPTMTDRKKASKATKKQWAAAKKRRKASTTSRTKPGSLQNSIRFTSSSKQADIFVPSNSAAGKYAARIHDEKGSAWHERGLGTKAKGAKADEKFIERAIKDNERNIDSILTDELGRGLPS